MTFLYESFNLFISIFFVKVIFYYLKFYHLISKKISSSIFRIIGNFTKANKTAVINCKLVFPNLDEIKIRRL